MKLYLVRHGIAVDRADPRCPPDPERYLTDDGIAKTRAAARGLVTLIEGEVALWTSPYERARQTARIIADALGVPDDEVREAPALLPERDPAELLAAVEREKARAMLVVGHAPNLDWVLSFALTGRIGDVAHLKKAGAACLELPCRKGSAATLSWLLPPKALRRLDV